MPGALICSHTVNTCGEPSQTIYPGRANAIAGPALLVLIMIARCTLSNNHLGTLKKQGLLLTGPEGQAQSHTVSSQGKVHTCACADLELPLLG